VNGERVSIHHKKPKEKGRRQGVGKEKVEFYSFFLFLAFRFFPSSFPSSLHGDDEGTPVAESSSESDGHRKQNNNQQKKRLQKQKKRKKDKTPETCGSLAPTPLPPPPTHPHHSFPPFSVSLVY
jgi:hypothetical protein